MKKILIFAFCFLLILTSCESKKLSHNKSTTDELIHENEAANITPFIIVNEENAKEEIETINWEKTISLIPKDAYTPIDGFHTVPTSATIYKNGNYSNLNINDPRLIRLLNFYNNEVSCGIYSYSQGTANELYEMKKESDFRLELTFEKGTSLEASFDKIVVIDDTFYCIRSNVPFEKYSYSSFSRTPLYDIGDLNWLSIFGF